MPAHAAAILPAPRAALTVTTVQTPAPAADEVLVRVRAVAINPSTGSSRAPAASPTDG